MKTFFFRTMRAKRLQTRQQNELPSAAKKSRQKTLPLKRGASSSRDTSPPKSVRKVPDKVDAHKKPVTKVMTKPKKDITTNESKPANKDDTKTLPATAVQQPSGIDSLKLNKKTGKTVVEDSKKKDVAKAANAKIKTPAKKDTAKQGIKKSDEKPSSSKDEKVSKELKNLGIDQSPSSNDKTIKASISEIVKTKSRTSASQSLYGKSGIGVEKASISKVNEHAKDGPKETITKADTNADEKKDLKSEIKEEKEVKATIKQIKKESSKECKKEKTANDADPASTAEKKQPALKAQTKKTSVENKESSTKSDAKPKTSQGDDKKEADVKKPTTQDTLKDNVKKLKKSDGNVEQKKKSKKSETELEPDQSKQSSKTAVKADTKKSKSPKQTKSKKETEKDLNKDKKIKDDKGSNQNIEKLSDPSNKELSKDSAKSENKDDTKASASSVENKQLPSTIKKSKSDNSGTSKKPENDANVPSTKTSIEDANKKSPKKENDDSKTVDATVKEIKKKNKAPKKSGIVDNDPKDSSKPKESRESSLASIAQTIEDVIAQAMNESISLEQPKVESEKNVKAVKSAKTPKVKKTESAKTDGSAVKRKYVKKKNKIDDQTEAGSTSKQSEQLEQVKESKIEPITDNKPSGKTEKEKENDRDKEKEKDTEKKGKKIGATKKKPKLCVKETEKTDGDAKIQPVNIESIKSSSESSTTIDKVSTSEASSSVKECLAESSVDIKSTQLTEKPSPSTDTTNDKCNDDTIPITELSDSQIKSTDCTIIHETEPAQINSKIDEPTGPSNSITNLDHVVDDATTTTSERIDNISSLIESPKFISEDSDDDDDDFFINLPANLTSATFSGLNIDKPIKEAHQSGSSVPTSVHTIPASTNVADDSNESTTTSSDESIDEKRRKKKPSKVAMKKKKVSEKIAKKKASVASKPSKASKSNAKVPVKVQPEKQVPVPIKSKISVKSLESLKNPVLEKKIKIEILSDDDACRLDDTNDQPSTSSQQPTSFAPIEPPTKRKYVRKKPLKSDLSSANKSKDAIDDDTNDMSKKDVYDFHESGHSSEDTCLSYKKNSKNDKDIENKKSVSIDKTPATKKKVAMPKKKVVAKKEDQTDDDQKTKMSKNDPKPKPSKAAKVKSSQQKRKPSTSHSDSSDSDDDKVLSKKFSKKKKMPSESSESGSESESESSDCEARVKLSADKNGRKKSTDSITGPKRHRMASLNALAKVQCLYENESRTAQELGFVKEPRTAPREKPVLLLTSEDETDKGKADTSSQPVSNKKDKETKKEKKVKPAPQDTKDEKQLKGGKDEKKGVGGSDDENEEDEEEEEAVVSRTLRTAPG